MDATQKDPQGTPPAVPKRGRAQILGKALKDLAKAVVKSVLYVVVTVLLILGFCEIYDILYPEKVPQVGFVGCGKERFQARINSSDPFNRDMDPAACWRDLQIPLAILKKVCPEAEAWVRERYASGKIKFQKEFDGAYAKYNYISGVLTINQCLFFETDGRKAVTLAHEFRHSRQNFTKPVRAVIACMIWREPQEWIVENDAYLFEKEVYLAIFD